MRLAFVTSLCPTERPDTGFEIANMAVIDGLRAAGHHVTVFGFARPDDRLRPDPDLVLIDRIVIENAAAGPALKARWLAAALAFGLPVASAKLRLADGGRMSRAMAERSPFDGVIVNSAQVAGAFPDLAGIAPAILVEHNIEHLSAAQNASHAEGWLARLLYRREARFLEAIERRQWAEARFVWCLAEEDRRMLGPVMAEKSAVLPLLPAVPPHRSGTARDGDRFDHDIGLIGTWTWEPNLIGLRWFLEDVVPLLPAGLDVAVAGRLPAGLAAPANVKLLGRVPDASAFLAGCRVVALASRAGTGIQLKTIEALALGLPAVATGLSMRGFAACPANVMMADDAAGFACALAGQVEAVAAGRVDRVDGSDFVLRQRAAHASAIARGLAALRPGRAVRPLAELELGPN